MIFVLHLQFVRSADVHGGVDRMGGAHAARLQQSTSPNWDPAERAALIEGHLPLVEAIARRFATRGEPLEDLVQVGSVGLIKAVDRFDPCYGVDLHAYAALTITGEIRRHLRDGGWPVRVPRRARERAPLVEASGRTLAARLERAPTPAELASETGLTRAALAEVQAGAAAARHPHPLDGNALDFPDPARETELEQLEDRAAVAAALARLARRERRVVALRYYLDLSQDVIAEEVGLSQVHVSRLLRTSLERMRAALGEA